MPQIAAAVGVSHNHLTRLFTAGQGLTVVGYLRRRRIEHARQLLVHSTMSITAIASTVGIPDLQAFNKACRTVTGLGPRALRESGSSSDGGGVVAIGVLRLTGLDGPLGTRVLDRGRVGRRRAVECLFVRLSGVRASSSIGRAADF